VSCIFRDLTNLVTSPLTLTYGYELTKRPARPYSKVELLRCAEFVKRQLAARLPGRFRETMSNIGIKKETQI